MAQFGCSQVGFESFGTDLPEDASQEELLKVVADYNANPKVGVHILGREQHYWHLTVCDSVNTSVAVVLVAVALVATT